MFTFLVYISLLVLLISVIFLCPSQTFFLLAVLYYGFLALTSLFLNVWSVVLSSYCIMQFHLSIGEFWCLSIFKQLSVWNCILFRPGIIHVIALISFSPSHKSILKFTYALFFIAQFEGAYLSDGKGLNNWDTFIHKPGYMAYIFVLSSVNSSYIHLLLLAVTVVWIFGRYIVDGSNGDIAVDNYQRHLVLILQIEQNIKITKFSKSSNNLWFPSMANPKA